MSSRKGTPCALGMYLCFLFRSRELHLHQRRISKARVWSGRAALCGEFAIYLFVVQYCVSPLCAILCIDVGLRVLCDAQLDILGIAACPVTSDQSHLSPLITLGASKTGPRPGCSVLTPAVHPGPDVQSRITALSHSAVSGPRSNSRTHVKQMSSNECSLCTRDFEQLGPRQVWN